MSTLDYMKKNVSAVGLVGRPCNILLRIQLRLYFINTTVLETKQSKEKGRMDHFVILTKKM